MISPEETPFLSLVERESIDGRHPEWQTDTLATPVITNQQIEGDEYAYTPIAATVRIGNYTEIARKSYLISGSEEKNTKAGPASELGRERRKKGTELKTDMEVALLGQQGQRRWHHGRGPQDCRLCGVDYDQRPAWSYRR